MDGLSRSPERRGRGATGEAQLMRMPDRVMSIIQQRCGTRIVMAPLTQDFPARLGVRP